MNEYQTGMDRGKERRWEEDGKQGHREIQWIGEVTIDAGHTVVMNMQIILTWTLDTIYHKISKSIPIDGQDVDQPK